MLKKFCQTFLIIGLVFTIPFGYIQTNADPIPHQEQNSDTSEHTPFHIKKVEEENPTSFTEIHFPIIVSAPKNKNIEPIPINVSAEENVESLKTVESTSSDTVVNKELKNENKNNDTIAENTSSTDKTITKDSSTKSAVDNKQESQNQDSKKKASSSEKSQPSSTKKKSSSSKSSTPHHFKNKTTLKAGEESKTIATVSGVGTVPIIVTRDKGSAAPNLPTYISVVCGNEGPYSGAFNTLAGETVAKNITINGNCKIKAKIAYPSSNWKNTHNSVSISAGSLSELSGQPFTSSAKWTTRPVTKSSSFEINTPQNFNGNVVLKMTGCSTRGGATDATKKFACDGYVQKKTGSKGYIEILNNGKVVSKQSFNIVYEKHHDTFTIPVKNTKAGTTIRIVKTSGAPVLLHGPGTKAVGVS